MIRGCAGGDDDMRRDTTPFSGLVRLRRVFRAELQVVWSQPTGGARVLKLERSELLFQAGAEQGLEEESPAFAATVEEPRKERTPRLDWAGLLKRTFALDVFACLRCGGRLKGVGVREGSRRGESD